MADPFSETVAFEGDLVREVTQTASFSPRPRVVADRYEVLGLLGTGGMGNVYRARDRELEEVVALKVLRPDVAASEFALSRFRREVKLARRVTHPNVARVFDIGDDGGERYLTMELVEGESLGALLARKGRLPIARCVEIATAVCAGLLAAHAAGVVHCDLKPDNVLLGPEGRVVVTDFGIARAAASGNAKATGTIVGTPAYMAPEQVEGKSPDHRADIYALGAMLYEMLTGEPPWRGDTVFAVAVARLLHEPPDPRAKRTDLGPRFGSLVTKCLAKEVTARFADVHEVVFGLSLAAEEASMAARSIAPPAISSGPLQSRATTAPAKTELAVLPFRYIGESGHEHIADGLTEDLIDLLSTAEGLRIRSRGTVMRYRTGDRDPREIGRELNVPIIVEGSLRHSGSVVRLSVRLVSVVDGVQIWHQRFERDVAEIFEVSDAVARAVSGAMAVKLSAPQRASAASAEAIDLYLRARSYYFRFFSDLGGESLALFEKALALAPDDPRILAGYAMAAGRFWTGGNDRLERARRAAERAAEHAPNLADSHVAVAMIRYQERREADGMSALMRALRLSRHNAEAHDMVGRMLAETELSDAGRKHLERALALEPDLQLTRVLLARCHMLDGDWDGADSVLDGAGKSRSALLPSTARLCLWRGDAERAAHILATEKQNVDPGWKLTEIVLQTVATRKWAALSVPRPPAVSLRFYGFVCQLRAELAMYLGEQDIALSAVEQAADTGIFDVAWADRCPLFAGVRMHDRFQAARARIAARAREISSAYTLTSV